MGHEELVSVAEDLRLLADRLGDVSISLLHQAMRDPEGKASMPARHEKAVTRARRSIDKAIHLLEGIDDGSVD